MGENSSNIFLSIPDPNGSPQALLACVIALRQGVSQLIVNAGGNVNNAPPIQKANQPFATSGALAAATTKGNQNAADIAALTLQVNSAVNPHAYASSGGSTATATLTLPSLGDVLILGSYGNAGVIKPSSGKVIVNVDGADHILTDIGIDSTGLAMPTMGMLVLSLAAGTHTLAVRAEFTGPPLSTANGVSIAAIGIIR